MIRPDLVATTLLVYETAAGAGATLAARIDAMRQALAAYEAAKAGPALWACPRCGAPDSTRYKEGPGQMWRCANCNGCIVMTTGGGDE